MCHLRPSNLLPSVTLRDRCPERARNWRGCTANTFIRVIVSKARQAEPSHLSVDVTYPVSLAELGWCRGHSSFLASPS